jgi:hypothetical protein
MRPAISRADLILAADFDLGGNLRLHFPDKLVLTPEFAARDSLPAGSRAVVIFDATREPAPRAFKQLVETMTGASFTNATFTYAEAPMEHFRDRRIRLAFAEVPIRSSVNAP